MTPAEKLAATKTKRTRKHPPGPPRVIVLDCRLKELRKSLRLTQAEVAVACGTVAAWLSAIERGASLQLRLAFRLAAFFGKTVEEIWTPLKNHEEAKDGAR